MTSHIRGQTKFGGYGKHCYAVPSPSQEIPRVARRQPDTYHTLETTQFVMLVGTTKKRRGQCVRQCGGASLLRGALLLINYFMRRTPFGLPDISPQPRAEVALGLVLV